MHARLSNEDVESDVSFLGPEKKKKKKKNVIIIIRVIGKTSTTRIARKVVVSAGRRKHRQISYNNNIVLYTRVCPLERDGSLGDRCRTCARVRTTLFGFTYTLCCPKNRIVVTRVVPSRIRRVHRSVRRNFRRGVYMPTYLPTYTRLLVIFHLGFSILCAHGR